MPSILTISNGKDHKNSYQIDGTMTILSAKLHQVERGTDTPIVHLQVGEESALGKHLQRSTSSFWPHTSHKLLMLNL